MALILIENEVHQLIRRLDRLEPKVEEIPELIARKLDEQADKLLRSRESNRDYGIRVLTLVAAVGGVVAALWKH